ncbi:ATP-grasp domain-containing protein [Pedobacter foliorum]|uniref:ATP-grasp domain-containing protein n=1 Tax=Pedobacter foliorum TaxID=2739058 RepID=UPI0015655182|nr:ATP-grasp domain-containing protein [Pedobacter foliorum]NRF39195.1 ATP-grasp domain-containing protein [Pedobacter foliorum]
MKNKMNILITGCGGDIGQSIGKILNESAYVNKLYGCDISEKNAAKFIFANFFLGLPYTDDNYLSNLEKIVAEKDIDIIIPISEPELRFFSKRNILDNVGKAKLLTASSKALETGFDKLKTADFLKNAGLPFPVTYDIALIEAPERYPVILKSKTGSGSSKVNIVDDYNSFLFIKNANPDYIVQEYLDGNKGEFTCGVFRSATGVIRTIILKRELMGGFSGYGEVIEDKDIERILVEIANQLDLIGSINVQLRVIEKGPVVFEINPRFSSTVRFRDMLGFEDVKWSIEDKCNLPLSEYNVNSVGKKFFKGFNEYIS